MGLRLILVSLVAGLGLSLPTADEVVAWQSGARSWMNDRLAAFTAPMPDGEDAFATAPAAGSPVLVSERSEVVETATTEVAAATAPACGPNEANDAAFDAAQADVVALFTADLDATPQTLETGDEATALAMNAIWEAVEPVATIIPAEPTAEPAAPSVVEPIVTRSERWSQAVRLTREAVLAWSELIHAPAVVTISE